MHACRSTLEDPTEITGFAPDEVRGRFFTDLVHPDDAESLRIARDALTSSRVLHTARVSLKRGGWCWLQGRYSRTADGRIVSTLHDVSEQRRQEQALAETRQAKALLSDAAGIGAWDFEPEAGEIVWWPGMEILTGWTHADIGPPKGFFNVIHPDDRAEAKRVFNTGVLEGVGASVDHRLRARDGRWVTLRATFTTEPRPGGLFAMRGMSQDITALAEARDQARAAAERLTDALKAAEAASEAKANFLANMSHEIRTPMNGVQGVLHILKAEALSPDGRRMLDEALNCSRMLGEILNDVLDISKIEAGQLEIHPEPLSPGDLIHGVVSLLRPQALAKGLDLRVDTIEAPDWVMADPVRLRQSLFNLVGNAVKFTLTGHVALRVSGQDGRLRFEIEDTGVGISPEAQAGLFERFHQAEASTTRRFGGSGLGLSITRRLAELMQGEVGLRSTSGQGSTFWLDIAAPVAVAPAPEATLAAVVLDGVRILLVEDNPTNRLIAVRMLESLGALVATAEHGEAGVMAAAEAPYDLILMDIQMPGIDGVEASRRIRTGTGPCTDTPIIALTANVLSHQHATYLAAGMNGVVGKPISPAELIGEIARLTSEPETTQAVSAA